MAESRPTPALCRTRCAVLCWAVLCWATLCWAALCWAMPCCGAVPARCDTVCITAHCCRSCLHPAGVRALQPACFSTLAGWGYRGWAFPPCSSPFPWCVPQNVRRQCSECWDAMQRYIEQPEAGELLMVQVGAAVYCAANAVYCAFCEGDYAAAAASSVGRFWLARVQVCVRTLGPWHLIRAL